MTAELHALLRPRFPGYIVSSQDDRREQEIKRPEHRKIVPDLVVHHFGTLDANLLVVEAKLSSNRNYAKDVWKLRRLAACNRVSFSEYRLGGR